jgi:hypothetical protein
VKRFSIATIIKIAFFILASIAIIHCKKDEPGITKVNFYLIDAPAYYEAVNLEIQKIMVRCDGSSTEQQVQMKNPGIYNLLNYSDGTDTLLGSISLTSGRINQIRLVFGQNNTFVNDSENVVLNISSENEKGVILKANQSIETGKVNKIWIDIDASRCVNKQGGGVYYFKPVIRIFSDYNTGSIKGIVLPKDVRPFVYASNDSGTIGTITDRDGYFMIKGLQEGKYNLRFVPQKPRVNEGFYENAVEVKQDSTSFIGTIVLN